MKIRQNKMMGYLAVTAGVGCAATVAEGAVVFYGNAGNNNLMADPSGLSFGSNIYGQQLIIGGGRLSGGEGKGDIFTRGSVQIGNTGTGSSYVNYKYLGSLRSGAVLGAANFANVSFNGGDGIYEAVAQFHLTGSGGGYLMAIATTNAIPNPQNLSAVGGTFLSIPDGKAMIDAAMGVNDFGAAVPEPSSLVLLALGATGLAARRQRRKAA